MQVINTNVMSLNAQRNLATSSGSLSTSIQRLSSGLRINSAKDDAAGLAIASRFTTQIRGLDQAARNANDAISLSQTAEGALGEVANNLQRIRELAIQSRNATNSTSDREALQAEVAQLKSEIQRVAEQTTFNGLSLLDGSFTSQAFQVGANQGDLISVDSIVNAQISALGSWNNVAVASSSVAVGTITAGSVSGTTTSDAVYTLAIDGNTLFTETVATGATSTTFGATGAELDAAWTTFAASNTGYTLSGTFADGTAVISKTDGTDLVITSTATGGTGGTVTAPTYGAGFVATHSNGTESTAQTGFSGLDVSTQAGADNAILAMDAALAAVNSGRADLGAIQNRFSSVVANLQTTSENLTSSRSRIVDADFAKETAELTRAQILQQAGTAMLAQANTAPQNVLSLLRG